MALQDAKAAKILVNDDVIIDVTYTTATEEAVFDGRTFLGADGRVVTGTLQVPLSYIANGGIAYIEKGCSTMHRNNLTNVIEKNGTDFPCIAANSLDKFDSFRYVDFNRKPVKGEYFLVHTLDKDLHIVSFLGQVISLDDVDQTFEYAIVFMINDAEAEALQVVYSDANTSDATTSDTKRPGNNGIVDLSDKTVSDLLQSFLSSTELTFNARVFNRAPKEDEYFSFVAKTKDDQLLSIFAQITEVPSPDNTTYKYKILTLPNAQIGFAGAGEHAEIFNDYINNKAIGDCSHAEGKQTTASGSAAHSEGTDTTASGNVSHAEGYTTTADGNYSHAEGSKTFAYGEDSHAEGSSTNKIDSTEVDLTDNSSILNKWATEKFSLAKDHASHVEGKDNLALGSQAHAEGRETIALGNYSHVEGQKTQAIGLNAHAEGGETKANGQSSHAEGVATIAKEHASHAEGYFTEASGNAAHAEGYYTTASGRFGSHAEGRNTVASGDYSHAEGEGSYSGIDYCINSLQYSPEEVQSLSSEDLQQIWTNCMKTFSWVKGEASHIEGRNNLVLGSYSHAEGEQNIVEGTCAHAEGCTNSASGTYSHTEGYGTIATSEAWHVQGKYNIEDIEDTYAHIVGNGTSDTDRSNAHTLDWKGNAWFAGDVYVDSTSGAKNKHAGSKKLATEEVAQQKADTALADAKAYTDETKNALLGTAELQGTYDTLKEIGAWIENSGVDTTELTSAIAGEAATREAADQNLSQQLTTMDAAIAGHTQSISNLSSGLDGLGNILENNYYSKSDIDQKLQDLPSSGGGGGGNASLEIDTDFSFESQNPVANKTITSVLSLLKTPVYTFDSVNHIYNYLGNMDAENDIFDKNTIIRVNYNQQIYYCIVVSKNEGWKDTDYTPTNMDVLFGDMEGSFFAPGAITCFETLGYKGYEAYWRIAVLPQMNEYYTPDIIDQKFADCAKKSDLNNYVTTTDVEQICKDELAGHGIEYQVKGNNRSATPLITEEGKYYWLRQINIGQDLCGLWWPGKDISSPADITFSEMEFVCATGAGFLGYRYRADKAENWTYGTTSVPGGTAILLGPGTIVQKTPVALI